MDTAISYTHSLRSDRAARPKTRRRTNAVLRLGLSGTFAIGTSAVVVSLAIGAAITGCRCCRGGGRGGASSSSSSFSSMSPSSAGALPLRAYSVSASSRSHSDVSSARREKKDGASSMRLG